MGTRSLLTPILVVSCDRYADIWPHFFSLFWKYWPDCPYDVYLGTNRLVYEDPRVTTLAIGEDRSWATSVSAMLDQLNSKHVILLLEDFLLLKPVESDRLQTLVELGKQADVGCLHLFTVYPPPRHHPKHEGLGYYAPFDPDAVNAQAALWKTDTLRKLLIPGFSPWEFEMIGNKIRNYMPDEIWGVYDAPIVYEQVVEKGKWKPSGLEICRRAGLEVDLGKRPAFSEAELQTHYGGSKLDRIYPYKAAAITAFAEGKRGAGIKNALAFLRHYPLSSHIWAILLFGVLGRGPMSWLQRQEVRLTVALRKRRHAARFGPAVGLR